MILDKLSLKGKVGMVTGGSRGIGKAAAETFAEAGADVVVASRTLRDVERAAEEIAKLGVRTLPLRVDVSVRREVEEMVQRAIEAFGRIDILVNNAGFNVRAASVEVVEENWDKILGINVKGAFICAQAVGAQMMAQRKGKIINIASLTSHIGIPRLAPYGVSKAGLAQLTKCLAVEWAEYNINVNAIVPGYIETDLTRPLKGNPDWEPWIMSRIPMKRWGTPEDLKGAFLFLASEASDYVTGHMLCVDGGWMAG